MPALTSTGTELRRFRGGLLPTVAIIALVLIPLLYGALYLWAFWDPTGRMDRLPVALVDADRPAALADGTPVHAGADVTDRLVEDGSLDWVTTDAQDAKEGVADGRYYFAVTLPTDFSAAVVSAAGDEPEQARIQVTYDDGNSFLADTLGHSAMIAVNDAVRATLGDKAVGTLLVGLGSTRDGLTTAADGAVTLEDAANQLTDGATQLASGADDAAAGATQLAAGADRAADGAAQLSTGARSAAGGASQVAAGARSAAGGAAQLSTGARSVADGAALAASGSAQLASGLGTAADNATLLDQGAAGVKAGVDQAAATIQATAGSLGAAKPALADALTYLKPLADAGDAGAARAYAELSAVAQGLGAINTTTLSTQFAALQDGATRVAKGAAGLDAGLGQLHTGAATLAGGTATLASGTSTLASGTATLATGTASLADGAASLASGTSTLASGAATLAGGTADLADGSQTLATGTTTLAGGAHQLADGGGQIADGAGTLATGLADGAAAVPDDDDTLRQARGDVIATPVTLDEQHTVKAEGFGEGFAPFFISLALFVGALITWLLLRPLPTRALASPASGLRATMAGFLPAAILGVGQVAVMMTVLKLGLHLDMATVAGTLGFTLLVGLAFVALQQMLTALLGSAAGKVTILALLMLQLASSGGTYPVETTPAFFRAIHPFLPMSYAVTGLREVITGGYDARLWGSVAVLVGVLVGSLAVTSWRAGRMRTWTLSRLHPALAL